MKIIVNRGFTNILSKIVVYKNSQKITECSINEDCCDFDANDGDQVIVKLKYLDSSSSTIASFSVHSGYRTFYVGPTITWKILELVIFKTFPWLLCPLFFILKIAVRSDLSDWFFTSIVVLTVLSLISLELSMRVPCVMKKMFKLKNAD